MKAIDPKYGIRIIEGQSVIAKTSTGEPIPDDEPLILFRARDYLALDMLRYYRSIALADGCTGFHMDGIDNRIAAFEKFRSDHPERMKQPGITRGL